MIVNDLKTFEFPEYIKNGEVPYLYVSDPDATVEDYRTFFKQIKKVGNLRLVCHNIISLPNGIIDHLEGLDQLYIESQYLREISPVWFKSSLTSLSISCPNLTRLPENMGGIKKLNSFRFNSEKCKDISPLCKGSRSISKLELKLERLERLPENFSNISFDSFQFFGSSLKKIDKTITENPDVVSIRIHAPLTEISGNFQKAYRLNHLNLAGFKFKHSQALETLPSSLVSLNLVGVTKWEGWPNFQNLLFLRRLTLRNNIEKTIPKSIGYCNNLNHVNLESCGLEIIPESLLQCTNLSSFGLRNGKISMIEPLNTLPNLKSLFIDRCPIKEIPNDWSQAKTLEILNINYCQIPINDLSFTETIPKLKQLSLYGNRMKSLTTLLTKKALPLSPYERNSWKEYGLQYVNFDEFIKIGSALARTSLPKDDQFYFLDFFSQRKDIKAVEELGFFRLLQATNINHSALRKRVQTRIDNLVDSDSIETLNTESLVFISGKTKLKKTELSKMFGELNIPYSSKFSEKVTHVILGVNCKDFEALKNKDFKILNESVFQKYYAQEKPKFLQEAAQKEGDNPLMNNVSQLLRSHDPANKMIGLSMLEAGGVPPDVAEDLIVIQKTTEDAKVRKQVTKLVQLNAPEEWQPVLRDKLAFRGVVNGAPESKTFNQLKKLAARTSSEMAGRLSCLLYIHYQRGLRYALRGKVTKNVREAALKLLFEGTHLDYSRGIGYKNWKGKKPDEVVMYSPGGIKIPLPKEALKLGKIESLNLHNCKYEAIPRGIIDFKDLIILDLSNNYISKIPAYVGQLNSLKDLDLSFNRFTEFPEILLKLPNLSRVDMRHNSSKFGNPFPEEEKEKMVAALPNCTVVFE